MSQYPSQDKTWKQLETAKIQGLQPYVYSLLLIDSCQVILQSENIPERDREECKELLRRNIVVTDYTLKPRGESSCSKRCFSSINPVSI